MESDGRAAAGKRPSAEDRWPKVRSGDLPGADFAEFRNRPAAGFGQSVKNVGPGFIDTETDRAYYAIRSVKPEFCRSSAVFRSASPIEYTLIQSGGDT